MDKPSDYGYFCDGINWLSVEDITRINKRLIEAQTPNEPISVIKPNELSSSQTSPSVYRYYEKCEDIFVLCSILVYSLIKNHCFENANKRTAMQSGYIFLLLNGFELTASDDDFIEMAEGIAINEYSREELSDWLFYWSREYDSRNLLAPTNEP